MGIDEAKKLLQGTIVSHLPMSSTVNLPVTIAGKNSKTGQQFVEEVVSLAHGFLQLGVSPGDVVVISAYNR